MHVEQVTLPRLLTRRECAEYLRVKPITVDRMLKKGLPSFRVGSRNFFDMVEVMDWLKQRGKGRGKDSV